MSKVIKITPQNLDELRRDFEEVLKGLKLSDGRINFTKTFGTIDRKATLYFTELAWLKMVTLVREFNSEIAWHGLVKRGDDSGKDEYVVSDILVYPQEVTGATVNTDQEKYQTWLMNHDDEVFNSIRMQGHSHVNMGTTPSAVDNSLYERILDQLDDDMFYIFAIWNKRGEKTIKIYDLAKNVLFETADVTVKILDDGTGIEHFLKEAKQMVQTKAFAPPAPSAAKASGAGCYTTGGNYGYTRTTQVGATAPKKNMGTPSGSGKKKKKKSNGASYPIDYGYDDTYGEDYAGFYGGYRGQ